MCELIRCLEAALPPGTIRTGCGVTNLLKCTTESGATAWRVDQDDAPYDHVVVATPPKIAAGLLSQHAPDAAEMLRSIESASTAIVVLAVRREDILRHVETFGMVVPPIEKRQVLAVSFASQKFAGRAPEDHVLIRVFIGGALQPHLLQRDDDQLVQLARDELADLIGLGGTPALTRVVRWHEAMPQYHVGHLPGLHLVSNALRGVGIAPVIQSAGTVAGEVIRQLRESSDTSAGEASGP
jgi:oxygen-dependent protoporphyrinogen oxidase